MSIQYAAKNVTYQLKNEHIRVGYLIDAIHNSNSGLQSATASTNIDNDLSGLRNDFESSAAYMILYDTVQNKQTNNNNRGAAEIPGVYGDDSQVSAFVTNLGIGNTNVNIQYHKLTNYEKLPKP